jgi:c-di-GMP-binding flagellar brake protein YcgR
MSKIEVGTKIVLEITGMSERLHSFFVGYISKRCVITMMPMVPVNRPLLLEHVYKGNTVTVRYIQSGAVFGFQSSILHFSFTPFPLIFLDYPEHIESHNLRKDRRVSCLFPALAVIQGQEFQGVLSNISQSGGRAFFPDNGLQNLQINIDDSVTLKCPILFQGPDIAVSSIIKRISKEKERVELGLKFVDIPKEVNDHIAAYIEQTILFVEE